MEKFVYLFRNTQEHYAMSPEAAEASMQKWTNWMGDLGKKGILTGGDPLQGTGKSVSGKNKVVTDGPFVEAKELVGGYLIINAKDINEAVEISKGCPIFETDGRVEVRPVQKM